MNKHIEKTYNKFGITIGTLLNDNDVIKITNIKISNINANNTELKNKILQMERNYPSYRKILIFFKSIFSNKPVTSMEYWISRGWSYDEALIKKSQQMNIRKSTNSVDYWLNRGYTLEEAKMKVSNEQSKRALTMYKNRDRNFILEKSIYNKEYWIKRNYTEQQAIEQISSMQSEFGKLTKNKIPINKRNTRIEFYLNLGQSIFEAEKSLKLRQSTKGPWKGFNEYSNYSAKVRNISEKWVELGYIENINLRGTEYHLDHIFSISRGFLQNISPNIIGHWTNLRIIPALDNKNKSWKCHKTKHQLIEDYNLYAL